MMGLEQASIVGRSLSGLMVISAVFAASVRAQSQPDKPNIVIASTILALPGAATPINVYLDNARALLANSFVQVQGLPAGTRFSVGYRVSANRWAIPIGSLANLTMTAQNGTFADVKLLVAVVDLRGVIQAKNTTRLIVAPRRQALQILQRQPKTPMYAGAPMATTALMNRTERAGKRREQLPNRSVAALPRNQKSVPLVRQPSAAPRAKQWARAKKLIERGNQLMQNGDVSGARLYYESAADKGVWQAALALAQTYDPYELNRWPIIGLQPDLPLARQWYKKARALGANGVNERLQRLDQN